MNSIPTNVKLLIAALVLVVILGAGLYVQNKKTGKTGLASAPTPTATATPSQSPTPTLPVSQPTSAKSANKPTPTPTPSNTIKFGILKGIYHPYKITIANGWTAVKTNDSASRSTLTITKGGYILSLDQDSSATPGNCKYPNETAASAYTVYINYVPIQAGPIAFRRGETSANAVYQGVCQSQINGYAFPTEFGGILYHLTATPVDQNIVLEMDDMVSSLRATE